jgi:peptidoglycan/xylan/chitin deacetylase (PgdA/CDA1 family)
MQDSFKKLVYNKYNLTVNLLPLRFLIRITKQKLILPCYHTVSNNYLPHIVNLYSYRNADSFKSDLEFFLKHYIPIDLFDLIKLVKEEAEPESNSFFLSFDDGLKEFYQVIAPILLEMGIPATCFLNSAFIDNKDLFFRYKASMLIELLNRLNRKSKEWGIIKSWFSDNNLPILNYKSVLLNIGYNKKAKMDELAAILNFSFRDYLAKEKPYLTSTQINELIKKGFTFGAHSIDHPEYRYLKFNEQIRQTQESINQITSKFNLNYRVFAFPFTDYEVSEQFFKEINRDDSIGFTAGSAGIKKDSVENNIHRIPMDEYNLKGRTRIKIDYIYYLVKAVFNRNKIIRK